jgi:peptidyl-prolyl cis-trans isomerase B (cyclophilin B)
VAGVEQVTAPEQDAAGKSTTEPGATAAEPAGSEDASGAAGKVAADSGAGNPTDPAVAGYRPRHARRRARRPWLVASCLILVLLAAGATAAVIAHRGTDRASVSDRPVPPAGIAPAPDTDAPQRQDGAGTGGSGGDAAGVPAVECRYERLPGTDAPVVPAVRPTRGDLVAVAIGTNRGPITLELDAGRAPCTVQSFLALASGGYFTDSACHRVTTALIFVVQCGDPTATGSGGPGYRFDDENLPTAGGYPRGTVAMANSGPNTNGGQFFLVYRDSPIDPNYPVFGRVTGGLEILDAVAAAGAPNSDGQPNLELIIESVQVS